MSATYLQTPTNPPAFATNRNAEPEGRLSAETEMKLRQREAEAERISREIKLQDEQAMAMLKFTARQNKAASQAVSVAQEEAVADQWCPTQVGFSMEEAKQYCAMNKAAKQELTPSDVLEDLQRGNTRFWMGAPSTKERNAFDRRSLVGTQFPSVAILSCADSRVPVETVFDQGLGEIFVVRVAGNCLDAATTGSLQYAVKHLGVKVLMVMGHEACGAVKAAGLPTAKIQQEPPDLAGALLMLKEGLDENRLSKITDAKAYDREAVITNIKTQVEKLTRDTSVMSKVYADELILVGGFYEISSGLVDFVLEVNSKTPSIASPTQTKPVKTDAHGSGGMSYGRKVVGA